MVSSKSILMVLLVSLAMVVAGCADSGKGKTGSNTGVPATAPTAEADKDTCAIDGLVVDEEFNPLPEAQVGILQIPDLKAYSAGDGRFTFSKLEPKSYEVAASKPGYEPDVKRAECQAGEIKEVTLSLVKIPDPQTSYKVIYSVEKGRIGCSVGFLFVSTDDFCKTLNLDPNARNQIKYRPDKIPITGAVYEVEWTPSGAFGGKFLALTYPAMKAQQPQLTTCPDNKLKVVGSILTGPSPICLRAESIDATDPLYMFSSNNTEMSFAMRAAGSEVGGSLPDDGSSKLVVGQDFLVYVALFYFGEPVPPGFTMRG